MNTSFVIHTMVTLLLLCPMLIGDNYLNRQLKLKGTESAIELYGLLLDQCGEPVRNAVVHYETEGYGLWEPIYKTGTVKSNEDGHFEIRGGKAGVLHIEDIVANGYEFCGTRNGDRTRFEFRTSRRERHHPLQEKPVVFHLRRKYAKATFLLKERFTFGFNANEKGKLWARDIAKGWRFEPGRSYENVFWDLEANGFVDVENKEWHLTIRTNGELSGIQVLNELLYEAPESGYQKSLDIVIPFSNELMTRHFYVRLRKPGFFARLDIESSSIANEKEIKIFFAVSINPFGDRSFEELTFYNEDPESNDLGWKAGHDAKDAFAKQHLAPRPPFEEWIKKGKAKY